MKLIIASLLVFSLVILFLFALFPSDISVTRVVQIRSTKQAVYKKIADLREWKSWNGLMINSFENKVYAAITTDSGKISRGNFSIILMKALPDTVITRWQNEKKYFTGNFTLSRQANGSTILEWTLYFHIKWYPWDKLASMFYEKQLGPLMEKSLSELQKQLEAEASRQVGKYGSMGVWESMEVWKCGSMGVGMDLAE